MMLTIFFLGLYVVPKNGLYQGTDYRIVPKDPNNPTKFIPTLNENPGLNYFDDDEKLVYVLLKGSEPIDLRMTSVVQVNNLYFCFSVMHKCIDA